MSVDGPLIFLAGVMQGSRAESIEDQGYRERLAAILARRLPAARVFDPFASHQRSIDYDDATAHAVFHKHLDQARRAALLIAFLPTASMGTAIEMHEARRAGVPIWSVTPLQANWVVRLYSDLVFASIEELDGHLARYGAPWSEPAVRSK